jgi:2-aminoethylphosphonate aminotransferase
MEIKRNILLNPGPATTTDTVKRALVVPDICHREAEFCDLSKDVHRRLVDVVNGEDAYVAVTFGGSGTAAVEAVIGSVVPQNRTLLIVENGAYGKRMRQIADTLRIDSVVHECSWEESPRLEELEEILRNADGRISHLAIVHHETTTGLLNPIRECASIAKRYGADSIVDGMSSYAGIPIDVGQWDLDYLISSSNKCVQGMAGISFAICRRSALERANAVPPRSVYLSLIDQYRALAQGGESRFTPPVQLFYALQRALHEYFEEGAENRYRRYVVCYEALLAGMNRLGFKTLLPEQYHSKLLTSFIEPVNPKYRYTAMHDFLFARGFTIYPGKLAGKSTLRLANIGQIHLEDIHAFLDALADYLESSCLSGEL